MKKLLHPGARWAFRFRAYGMAIFFSIFLGWFVIPVFGVIIASLLGASTPDLLRFSLIGFVLYVLIWIVIGEIYSKMSYSRWFYDFTESELKLERGIIWKRYTNVPYDRVQNVDISRGIIARIFGFSSVNLQTAGYSAPAIRWGNAHSAEGYIPAVELSEAENIRAFVMKKISKYKRR